MLTQLQSYRDDVSRLELELSDARKETARLQADDSKASSKKDTSNEKDEDVSVAAKSEDIHMDDDDDADKSNERKELKDEVAFLRGALNDAIGEASRSQNILNSLESRLHEKESLIYFCQKVKKESESLIRMKSENITDANSGNVDNKETTTVPVEADKEDSSKDVAQEGGLLADTAKANLDEIQSQLFDTKQLLEQNKKLVTVLQNKVQNMDDDIYGKDQMIKDLLMRLEVLESENSRAQTQLLIYEKRFSTLDGDDEEEEDDDDEDDDDDDDEEEEEGSYQGYDDDEGGHGGPGNDGDDDSEVEIIEVIDNDDSNDDDEEDEEENDERNDDHQQDEVHQRPQNSVIDEHIQDDAGEQEPSPKKQRMEDSSIVDHDTLDV